jgi:hypothetical protein
MTVSPFEIRAYNPFVAPVLGMNDEQINNNTRGST